MLSELLEKILLEESVSGDKVVDAIKTHRCVTINYNSTDGRGEHTGERFIVPFAYGVTKAGNPVLRAFQPYGDSTSEIPRWKYFRLDRIDNWRILNRQYTKDDIDKYCSYGDANYEGDNLMSSVYVVTSFAKGNSIAPNDDNVSGVVMNNGEVKGEQPPSPTDAQTSDVSKQSGPKMVAKKEYNVGDVIPYKEFMRRNVDFRHGTRKNDLTRLANQMYKSGKLNGDEETQTSIEKPSENTPTLGQVTGWKNKEINARDQVNDRLSGLEQQLANNPQKIDLSQFDKYERNRNRKR